VKAEVAKALSASSTAVEGDGTDNTYYGEPHQSLLLQTLLCFTSHAPLKQESRTQAAGQNEPCLGLNNYSLGRAEVAKALSASSAAVEGDGPASAYYGEPHLPLALHTIVENMQATGQNKPVFKVHTT
jgi:hypothetical protein